MFLFPNNATYMYRPELHNFNLSEIMTFAKNCNHYIYIMQVKQSNILKHLIFTKSNMWETGFNQ